MLGVLRAKAYESQNAQKEVLEKEAGEVGSSHIKGGLAGPV